MPDAVATAALPAGSHRWRASERADEAADEADADQAGEVLDEADVPRDEAGDAIVDPQDACVLHYANLGIEAFGHKYAFRRLERLNTLPFHVAAVAAANGAGGTHASRVGAAGGEAAAVELLRDLYRRTVLLDDEAETARQLHHGVCFAVEGIEAIITLGHEPALGVSVAA